MSLEICAVVDRVPDGIAPARALGAGPYVIVARATDASLEERLAARLGLFRALAGTACLPFRFGSAVEGEAGALAWLAERRGEIDRALARVARRVEFDLHLPAAPAAPALDGDGPGTRHLRALAARHATLGASQAEAALSACRDLPGVEDTAVSSDGGFIAFLVADAPAFRGAARSVRIDGARWSGPWPAFTFAARWIA